MEKLIENKLSREQMPTIYHSRHEKWCREASITKQKGMEATENKKVFFKKLEKMETVINSSSLKIRTEQSRQKGILRDDLQRRKKIIVLFQTCQEWNHMREFGEC